jgi:hypothetical protein
VIAPSKSAINKYSTISVGVYANRDRLIPEKTYDNNYKEKMFKVDGVFCP